MSGTKAGGKAAAATNKQRYGQDFYKRVGRKGGSKCVPKGFAINPEIARIASAKGGAARRKKRLFA